MAKSATVYTETGATALVIQSITRKGDKLVMDGKALGTMRMDMVITLREFFNVLRIILSWGVISFLLLLPFFGLKNIFRNITKQSGRISDAG